jgi:hypothetical protein
MHRCSECNREITPSPAAPIIVTIHDPESIGADGTERSFCCWPCAAIWFNAQAGEPLMPDLDSEFYRG